MKNFHRVFLIAGFFLSLAAPVLNDSFHFVQFERADENRRFHDSLSINFAKLDDFPEGCQAYVDDNFSFRSPLIQYYKQLKFRLYRVSPNPERLIVGRNGRYFNAGEEKKAYEGDLNFTPEELDQFEAEWLRRKHYFDSLGIVVYMMPAPTALEIYPEDLPSNIRPRFNYTPVDQLKERFKKKLPGLIVDPRAVLKAGKKDANIYFMLDNHWTDKGGFLASKLLLEQMKKEHFPELDLSFLQDYNWKLGRRDFGHFVAMIGVGGLEEWIPVARGHHELAERAPNYDLVFTHEGISEEEQQYRFVQKKPKNKLKLLMIRDSFGQAIYPFMKEPFSESLFIFDEWNYRLNKSIVEKYRPDVVVYLTYDPGMRNQIDPANRE